MGKVDLHGLEYENPPKIKMFLWKKLMATSDTGSIMTTSGRM